MKRNKGQLLGIGVGAVTVVTIALAAGLQRSATVHLPQELAAKRSALTPSVEEPVPQVEATPAGVCGSPLLEVTPFKTQPTYPEVSGVAGVQDEVGDIVTFKAYDFNKKNRHSVVARLERKGTHSYIYVDTTITVSDSVLDQLFTEFDSKIYPNSTSVFGNEPKPGVDADTLVTILLYDIRDDRFYDSSVTTFIAGFFDPNNQRRKVDFSDSNEREMVYVDSEAIETNTLGTLAVLAHEFQHLIHFNQDANETSWVNEGLSEYAIVLNGYPRRPPTSFFDNPDNGLTDWRNEIADYDQSFLLMVYLAEHYGGDELIGAITRNTLNGIDGIEAPLATMNPGATFNDVFADWAIANYLDDTSIGEGRYGYDSLRLPKIRLAQRFFGLPVQNTFESLKAYAADYIEFQGGEDLVLNFNGNGNTPQFRALLVKRGLGVEPVVEEINLDSNNDGSTAVTDYGTTYNKATLIPVLMPPLGVTGAGYSFSADGTGAPTVFEDTLEYHDNDSRTIIAQLGIPSMLIGGEHWDQYAVRFSPQSEATLIGAEIAFWKRSGTGGKVRVYVHADTATFPGAKLDSVDMTDFTGTPGTITWNYADFSTKNVKFAEGQEFHISWTLVDNAPGDTVWAILDTAKTATDRSSVYIRERQRWGHFVGGFNFFLRAIIAVPADNSVPQLTTGILQNPVFTEAVDVFAISPKALNPASVKGKILISGVPRLLGFRSMDEEDKVFIDQNYVLHGSGTATLITEAQHKFGTVVGTDTLQFNVQLLSLQEGGQITSLDGDFDLRVPPTASEKEVYLTVMPAEADFALGTADIGDAPAGLQPWSEVYSVGPAGLELPEGTQIRFRYRSEELERAGIDPRTLRIAILRDGQWQPLPTRLEPSSRALTAEVKSTGAFRLLSGATPLEDALAAIPSDYYLNQNFPNPFNPSTTITYGLPKRSRTRLVIYNLLGQQMVTLVDRDQPAGRYQIVWDGRDAAGRPVASGVYVYRLQAGDFVATKKLVLVK
jgi:hypothetical protein